MTSFVDISRPIVHPCQLGNFLQFCLIFKAKRASAPPKKTREKFLLFKRGEIFNYMKDVILHCLYTWYIHGAVLILMNLTVRKVFIFTLPDPKQKNTENFRQRAEPSQFSWKRRSKGNPNHVFFFPTVNSNDVAGAKIRHAFLGWQHDTGEFMDLWISWVCVLSCSIKLQSETPPQKNPAALFFFWPVFCRPSTKRLTTSTIRLTWFLGLFLYHFLFLSLSKSTALFLTLFLFDESLWRTNKWLPRNRKDTKILPHPCSWSYEMICVCV